MSRCRRLNPLFSALLLRKSANPEDRVVSDMLVFFLSWVGLWAKKLHKIILYFNY